MRIGVPAKPGLAAEVELLPGGGFYERGMVGTAGVNCNALCRAGRGGASRAVRKLAGIWRL